MIITDKAQIKAASLKESDKLHLTTSDELECYELIESDLKLPADATFTRSSVAHLSDGTQVDANMPRFEQGRFGKAVMVEEGTTNLLSNPSFESDSNGDGLADSWSVHNAIGTTCSYQRVIGKYGSYAQRMTKTGWITQTEDKFSAFIQKVTGLTAGTTYVLSVDYKLTMTSSSVDAPRSVGVVIYHKDSSNSLKNTTVSWGWAPTAEWIRKTVTFTLATGADRIEIELRMSCNGTVDWDGVQLEAKPYATSFVDGTRAAENVSIPTSGILNPQEGTIEFWWMPINQPASAITLQSNSPPIIQFGDYYEDNSWVLWATSWQGLSLFMRGDGVSGWTGSPTIIPGLAWYQLDKWYHFAVRWYDSDTFDVFVDDVKYGSYKSTMPFTGIAGNYIALGNYNVVGGRANALFDDLRISNRARSDEEILAAYQSGQPLAADEWTTYKLDFDDKIRITTQGQIICNELIEI